MKKEDSIEHRSCLLLNADYSPFGIIDWMKAVIWSLHSYESNGNYPIEIIDFYKGDHIQGVGKRFPVPAVAKTKRFFAINNQNVNFSRKNILIRDNYTCQYCSQQFAMNELTYDHVIPKSVWRYHNSPTSWTNIVTCCIKCNRKKGNKTPKEAGMKLLQLPEKPKKNNKYLPVVQTLTSIKDNMPDEWKQYLPQSYFL